MSLGSEIVLRDVTNAGIVISDRIGREAATQQLDLEESVEASRYSSHPYSTYPKEWPSLVEVVDTRDLPAVLVERYNAAGGEGTALCGIFPEIRRAWASVDNSVFLWRFDRWDGLCPEYSRDEQAICAVGLVRSKAGVFIEAINYLLVLATPIELVLVGVCCSEREDGRDPYKEISLQSLPEYAVPSDGVSMTCVTSTNKGRIFLAGRDGHIYELEYTTGSLWHKRCRKICLTAGLGSILSRWVIPNVFKFGAVDPIVEMVVDNERHILYARTLDMKLLVYSLGPTGDDPLKKVAEEKNLVQRDGRHSSRQSSKHKTQNQSPKLSINCIAPLSLLESRSLHLVAVLSDGRRLYLSTASSIRNGASAAVFGADSVKSHSPSGLKVVTTRSSPPLGASNILSFGSLSVSGRPQGDAVPPKVETSFYSTGNLVLSDASSTNMSSVVFVTRDFGAQTGGLMASSSGSHSLREHVSSVRLEGRMLMAADILPSPGTSLVQSLYSRPELHGFGSGPCFINPSLGIYAKGDLSTQHILPRRRLVLFSTMGLVEIIFNRPVDILKKMLESHSTGISVEDFFNRFGIEEAAAMCLMLAAKLVDPENIVSSAVSEKAAEAFEDPRLVGIPQLGGRTALSNTKTAAGGFSMGQVVQEAEPVFSGMYDGLCVCASRLLYPVWEFPIMVMKGSGTEFTTETPMLTCRLDAFSMQVLEDRIRSLEKFLRSRRTQRRGLYGCVAGVGDSSGMITSRKFLGGYPQSVHTIDGTASSKRQRLSCASQDLVAMEVHAIECIRQVILRSGEALFLLQLISQHHATRLVQGFDASSQRALIELTFNQMVCSEIGDQIASKLISSLMECYTGSDGKGTVADISGRLREGCPSYYKESDYKFYLAVEDLERASAAHNMQERESLARAAFKVLSGIPESVDLRTVCKRFEDLRFYEAVVSLPLQKAQVLDLPGDASNEHVDPVVRERALVQRVQCYEIITAALSSLNGPSSTVDEVSRKGHIARIVQLGIKSSDKLFHEYLYRAMIDLGLESELLEYGGPDLVPFLQRAGREATREDDQFVGDGTDRAKYLDMLAKLYVSKRQHTLAAHVLLRLAERRPVDPVAGVPTLEQRRAYLSNAVLQARSSSGNGDVLDRGLVDLLEAKLAVLNFQTRIRAELSTAAARSESSPSAPPAQTGAVEAPAVTPAVLAASSLALDLKNISQLYNEYAVPFGLHETCLEMLHFASLSGDADTGIVKETWVRLLNHCLSAGGVAEACAAVRRVGPRLYPGDTSVFPLDSLCLVLEKAAMTASDERVADDEVPGALLSACAGAPEPVLNAYDHLLSSPAVLPLPGLRLRLLRSVLSVLRQWSASAVPQRSVAAAAPTITGSSFSFGTASFMSQGTRDRIIAAVNRYAAELRRLPLHQSQIETVYKGFRELEEVMIGSISLDPVYHFLRKEG